MSRGGGTRKMMAPEKAELSGAFEEEILTEVQELFNKVKGYSPPPGEWCLPDPSKVLHDLPVSHPCLQDLKRSLNEVKNELSDKNLEVWHQHTNSTNRAGTVTAYLRANANAELCTQAWAKFYEILGTFQLLPEGALQHGELNSVHLCEAPGAFISALNHFLKTSGVHCDWTWVANTLNPYHEANSRSCTIADDRLIANTLPWWFFGSDDTGDIMLQKHLLELQTFVGNMHCVDLVTADGSFDCQGDPGEQESLVAPLQYCETVCALLLLGPGGSFILKMFTLFEHSSVCLLYLLVCCFRSVSVFKPATSKAGNSEVYVVCLDYQAKEAIRPLLSKLVRNYGPDLSTSTALFPSNCIPASFLQQHKEICAFFHALQVNTIRENIRLFAAMSPEQHERLGQLRECAAQTYTSRFQVQPLARNRWLCRSRVVGAGAGGGKSCQRKQVGSFNQRKELQCLGWRQRLTQGPHSALLLWHSQGAEECKCVLKGPSEDCDVWSWFTVVGAAINKVRSSPFCEQGLLELLNEAIEEQEAMAERKDFSFADIGCSSCIVESPSAVLSELCCLRNVTSCVVLGSPSSWDVPAAGASTQIQFSRGPSGPQRDCTTLYDGEVELQRDLFSCVLPALSGLQEGAALVLPLGSALTRVTAGLVYTLHHCFHSIEFRCTSTGGPVALLCVGFKCPFAFSQMLEFLQGALEEMGTAEQDKQLLQFVPMDELLKGSLPHFLFSLNTMVARLKLHLLIQQGQTL